MTHAIEMEVNIPGRPREGRVDADWPQKAGEIILTNGDTELRVRPSLTGFSISSPDDITIEGVKPREFHIEADFKEEGNAYVIPCDRSRPTYDVKWPVDLESAQQAVSTGTEDALVESVPLTQLGAESANMQMYAHEEGLIHQLPFNDRASKLANWAGLVGDVLVLEGAAQWE